MSPDILAEALALCRAGYATIRASTDGQKKPLGSWEKYQVERPSEDQVTGWFKAGHHGVGIVCGQVSGNAEMLEFEGRAVAEGILAEWVEIMDASGLEKLREKLRGWIEQSPAGGYHIHYRVDGKPVPGNTKLARRLATADELADDPKDKIKVLIETRGEGGFVVTAPSNGTTHPSGEPWTLITGSPVATPVLTSEEHEALHDVCRMLDRMPEEQPPPPRQASGQDIGGRPGDDYNDRENWAQILDGWTAVYTRGSVTYWRRPGKNIGVSATTGRNDADNLYVFSTSTEFDAERPYSKFAAYTLLNHRGDYSAAAKALRASGYGDAEPSRVTTIHENPGEWPEPTPLGQTYPQPLPIDACGPVLGPMVTAIADQIQVPTDLIINMGLSVIAAAAQGCYRVQIENDWTEILSISSTTVAASGERKSPVMSMLTRSLVAVEDELREAARLQSAWANQQIKLAEERVTQARRRARDSKDSEYELKIALEELEALAPVPMPRLFADDATPEALMALMGEQNGSTAVLSSEPGFFLTLAGRYSSGVANLDGVLKATSGDPVRVDRKGGDPLIINEPCLSVCLCIQPGLLDELRRRPELRHSGLLARFLYVLPRPMVGRREVVTKSTQWSGESEPLQTGAESGIVGRGGHSEINSVDYVTPNKIHILETTTFISRIETIARASFLLRSPSTKSTKSTLSLDPEAQAVLTLFRKQLEPRLDLEGGDLGSISDWGSKLPGTAARIAAALTLLDDFDARTISGPVMDDATRLCDGYIPHALAVLNAIRGDGHDLSKARAILELIRRNSWSAFSRADVYRSLKNTSWLKLARDARERNDILDDELDILVDYGHIRPLPDDSSPGAGRKPGPRYEVNPVILGGDP